MLHFSTKLGLFPIREQSNRTTLIQDNCINYDFQLFALLSISARVSFLQTLEYSVELGRFS